MKLNFFVFQCNVLQQKCDYSASEVSCMTLSIIVLAEWCVEREAGPSAREEEGQGGSDLQEAGS